jgi:hypothetical protein
MRLTLVPWENSRFARPLPLKPRGADTLNDEDNTGRAEKAGQEQTPNFVALLPVYESENDLQPSEHASNNDLAAP